VRPVCTKNLNTHIKLTNSANAGALSYRSLVLGANGGFNAPEAAQHQQWWIKAIHSMQVANSRKRTHRRPLRLLDLVAAADARVVVKAKLREASAEDLRAACAAGTWGCRNLVGRIISGAFSGKLLFDGKCSFFFFFFFCFFFFFVVGFFFFFFFFFFFILLYQIPPHSDYK
jgi:hypothetical protein